jgi:pyridoxamine 5'-phosphate oxidase
MNFKDCIAFANEVKDCAMATVDGGNPRVRMMGLWFADETGFYFQAWTFKEVYRQLKANPKIEVCFYKKGSNMIRINGDVEFIKDDDLQKRLWKERQFLKGLGAKDWDDPRLVIFKITHGKASIWPIKKEGQYPGVDIIEF